MEHPLKDSVQTTAMSDGKQVINLLYMVIVVFLSFNEDAFESATCRPLSRPLLNAAGFLFGACFYYNFLMILCLQSVVLEYHSLKCMPIGPGSQQFEKGLSNSQGIV